MAIITREQLLELDAVVLGRLTESLPPDLQDDLMLLLADLLGRNALEIPEEYIRGVIDDL